MNFSEPLTYLILWACGIPIFWFVAAVFWFVAGENRIKDLQIGKDGNEYCGNMCVCGLFWWVVVLASLVIGAVFAMIGSGWLVAKIITKFPAIVATAFKTSTWRKFLLAPKFTSRLIDRAVYYVPRKLGWISVLVLFLAACSHIPVDDARWISQNAHSINISDVKDRLGEPEQLKWEGGTEVATYSDHGRHLSWLTYIPIVNFVCGPIILIDMAVDQHWRELTVRYDSKTGKVYSVDHRETPRDEAVADARRRY